MPAHNEQTKLSEDLIVSDDQERDYFRIGRGQSTVRAVKGYHQIVVAMHPFICMTEIVFLYKQLY